MKISIKDWFAIGCAIFGILICGGFVLLGGKVQKQREIIAAQKTEIEGLKSEISGLVLSNQAEQMDALEEVATIETQCAEKIKNAVAGAKVPPREKVVFQTKTEFVPQIKTEIVRVENEKSCPDNDAIAAYGLRDIQTAGDN